MGRIAHDEPSKANSIRIALLGDMLIARRFHRDCAGLRKALAGCSLVFGNLEGLLHNFEAAAARPSGGTWTRADPEVAKDLRTLGIKLVSLANNHAGDYGVDGARTTVRHLRAAGIAVAGWGESLEEAASPAIPRGDAMTAACVAVTSTFPDHSMASNATRRTLARPGVNPLRMDYVFQLPAPQLRAVDEALRPLGIAKPEGGRVTLFGRHRLEGGDRHGYTAEPRRVDLARMARSIQSAPATAPVIVSHHIHPGKGRHEEQPDEGQEAVARAAIDAGASVVVGHGPHTLRPVEFYGRGVILYGLGSAFLEAARVWPVPWDAYDELGIDPASNRRVYLTRRRERTAYLKAPSAEWGVAAVVTLEGSAVRAVKAIPLSVAGGRPAIARGMLGKRITDTLRELSTDRGTRVSQTSPAVLTPAVKTES